MGKLKLDSHETHIEEPEERIQVNHQNSDLIESLKSVISEHEEVIVAYLYGSAAQGIMRADSDIDVGILLANDAARSAIWKTCVCAGREEEGGL